MDKKSNITRFSYNWNGKLNCRAFTTIRLLNKTKYAQGSVHQILLKNKERQVTDFGRAVVVEAKEIRGNNLNEFIAHLDTGYSMEEMKGILKKMYKGKNIEETMFSFVLFKYLD